MTLPLFAGYEDLARHLQITTQDQADVELPADVAQQVLEGASAAIRAACRWSVLQETVTDSIDLERSHRHLSYVEHRGGGEFYLPTLQLSALALSVSGVAWVDGVDYLWRRTGRVRLLGYVPRWQPIVVTYTHGYTTVPAGLRQVCVEVAARSLSNPRQLSMVTVGNVSETYWRTSAAAETGQLDADPRVAAYVLPVVG